jgi:methyl-accepting chemotaxis protein
MGTGTLTRAPRVTLPPRMRLAGTLLRDVAGVAILASLIAFWVVSGLPLDRGQLRTLELAFLVAVPLELAGLAVIVSLGAGPIQRALDLGEGAPGAVRARAAAACHRLSAGLSGGVLAGGCATTVGMVGVMRRVGMPPDLAVAGACIGVASTILAAMMAYSLAAAASAHAFERLGADAEARVQGTVRVKILILGFGLNTIGVLLFASTSYVRFRVENDREYVAAAERAQESAMAALDGAASPELAEHAWLVTGAPAALFTSSGRLAARFGPSGAAFEALPAVAPGVTRLSDGWLVARRAGGGSTVASWLPEAPLWARRRAFWTALALTGAVVYLATALLAWLAARAITIPFRTLGRAADRIASGDLTASPPSISRDEMGQLASDFRRMAQGLKRLVVDVQAASEGVSTGAREAGAIGERVRRGALDQHAGVVSVQAAVAAMEGSISLVSRGVGGLSEYVSATGHAMAEMAAAHEEVRRQGVELERAMAEATHDVEQLGRSGREAESTLGKLESLAGHAGGTLAAVRVSVSGLERAAGESEVTAAKVAEMAERAGGVVEETVYGIDTLRAAVSDAHRRITALGRRSDDIDQVVDFISEVAKRTNLLSLNASIIAAQAGEHGKAFAVVADQIRELAAQIARSTTSIGDIIHSVREDVEATAALIDRGDALAVEGVQLARNSLEALGHVQRSTAHGRETAVAIRAAVEAHAASSREVSQLVESVTEGSRAVAAAVQLVGRSVSGVNSVSRGVSAMADQVARALEEQSGLGRRQTESLSRPERMILEITRAVESHDAATRRVRDALQALSQTAGEHESAVEGLSGVAGRLGSRATALADSVGRFKV